MPMFWFWIFAGLMLATALALLLAPLLGRAGNRAVAAKMAALRQAHAAGVLSETEYAAKLKALADETGTDARPRAPLPLVLGIALALPLAAVAIYFAQGNPKA